MEQIKYPIGIQTFGDIIEGGYKYVDKTRYVWQLVSQGKFYFLSRPRRFGKSLLLSTIEAFFRGRRDLFQGLYISTKERDWAAHPVFHLALNGQRYSSVEMLEETLHNYMDMWEEKYGFKSGDASMSVSTRFFNCILSAYRRTGQKVVVLIDEYDQPLLQNMEAGKEAMHEEMRQHLHAFYSVMKAQDQYIRFAILTGISKFSKVSVFSGLNNLNDISLDIDTNAICGISETELLECFPDSLKRLAAATGLTMQEATERLRREYDGYHFAKSGEGIYNPFSVLNALAKKDFRHYWMATGTPSFLIRLLQDKAWSLSGLCGVMVSEADIIGSDRYMTNPVPLLFQSGYLTIKGYDPRFNEYALDYPNEEVAEGFSNDLLKAYSCRKDTDILVRNFVKDVENGRAEAFMETLRSLLSGVPYDQILDKELHYQNMMYLVMKLMGFYTRTEYRTSHGRIDMVVETGRYLYILEFKLHGTAREAMEQIRSKDYAMPFAADGRRVVLIGAAFSQKKRTLDSWIIQPL